MVKILADDALPQSIPEETGAQADLSADQLMKAILSLEKNDLIQIVQRLMPYVAMIELRQPRIWGDSERVIMRTKIHVNDLLINTRSGTVTIEEEAFFGHRCQLLTGTHDYRKKGAKRLDAVPDSGRDIHIKKGAWLGSGVTVLGPCVIGEHAVIAAGSIVTVKEIPAGTIWAGQPARQVKVIDFDEE